MIAMHTERQAQLPSMVLVCSGGLEEGAFDGQQRRGVNAIKKQNVGTELGTRADLQVPQICRSGGH